MGLFLFDSLELLIASQPLIPNHNHLATLPYSARINLVNILLLYRLIPYKNDHDLKGIRYGTDE
jgi:hypothetical protein